MMMLNRVINVFVNKRLAVLLSKTFARRLPYDDDDADEDDDDDDDLLQIALIAACRSNYAFLRTFRHDAQRQLRRQFD